MLHRLRRHQILVHAALQVRFDATATFLLRFFPMLSQARHVCLHLRGARAYLVGLLA
jgi:hypothetical protein